MFEFPVLIGDIGGTNARFAVLSEPGGHLELLPRAQTCAAPDPVEAIREALGHSQAGAPRMAMVAVATRVDAPVIRLTNADWTVDAGAIGRAFGLSRVDLVNDYTPVAASIVALDGSQGDLVSLGGGQPGCKGARLVLGPGTGFGVAALVPVEERHAIFASEAGHVEFGPAEADEWAIWPHLERVGGRITGESVISGPGLLRIARALAASRGESCPFAVPNEVLEAGKAGHPLARTAVMLFARALGRFAGDLALAFEAEGGVFVAGGIAPRMLDLLAEGPCRDAFERKAPHADWARRVPLSVITHPEPALLGLSVLVTRPADFVFRAQAWQE
jgi:glucokinase